MAENADIQQINRSLREVMSEVIFVKRKLDVVLKTVKSNETLIKETNSKIERMSVQQPPVTDTASPQSSPTSSLSSTSEDKTLTTIDRRTSCMANAFQRNIKAILHNIKFEMIQDKIVERDLVTTSESEELSHLDGDRTKMRVLVTNIMDKKIDAMQTFLELIGEYIPELKGRIQNAFDSTIDSYEDSRSDKCTACLIQERIPIRDLSDSLVDQGIISRDLYKNIAHERSMLTKKLLWQRIFDTISPLPRSLGAAALKRALTDDEGINSHADIVSRIERDLARNRKSSRCRCKQKNAANGTTGAAQLPYARYSTPEPPTPDNLSDDDSDTSTIEGPSSKPQQGSKEGKRLRIPPEGKSGLSGRPPIPSNKPVIGNQTNQPSTSTHMGARPKTQIGDHRRSQDTLIHEIQGKLASKTTTKPQSKREATDETKKMSFIGNKEGSDNPKAEDSDRHPVLSKSNVAEQSASREPLRRQTNSNSKSLNAASSLKTTELDSMHDNAPSKENIPMTGHSHTASASSVPNETAESTKGQLRDDIRETTPFSQILKEHEQRTKINDNVEPGRNTPIPNGNKFGKSRRYHSVTEQKGNITSASNVSAKQSSVQKAVPKSAVPSTGKSTDRPRPRRPKSPIVERKIRQLNKEEDIPEEDD